MKYLFLWGFLCVNLESKIGIPPVFDHWATKLYWKHRSLLEFHHCKENQTHKHMSYHPTRGISPIHALIPPTSFSNLTKISFRNPVSVISQKCSGYRTLTLFLPPWLVTSSSQPRRWGEGSHGSPGSSLGPHFGALSVDQCSLTEMRALWPWSCGAQWKCQTLVMLGKNLKSNWVRILISKWREWSFSKESSVFALISLLHQ